ncbi:MAG: TRAP transporter substrate-binding protein DctP [Proteobacteria bacterium]|nr:TRAP transporter substrate-binding protein DctP [Pseudomonadota bacterium]
MKRRTFLKASVTGAAIGAVAAPSVLKAAETFKWKMTTSFPPGLPFYQSGPGSAEWIVEAIEELSGGRLKVKLFAAGELIPWNGGFDAVTGGTVEMNSAVAYYWSGKVPALQYFGTVPFGMSFQGQNAWYYHGGGLELWNEIYSDFGAIGMPCGNSGVQMTGWFKNPVNSLKDFDGLKMRIPGLGGKIYKEIGVNVKLLGGGEIFPALERGVIDAAEWVGPVQDRRLGLHKAAKNYYSTGWHEPSTTTELLINKAAFEKLPGDIQGIIRHVARSANITAHTSAEALNGAALDDLVKNHGVQVSELPTDVIEALRVKTAEVLAAGAAADPVTRKVHESFMAFKKSHDRWANSSERQFAIRVRGG